MSGIGRAILLATLAVLTTGALKAASPAPGTNFFENTISGINLGGASGGFGTLSDRRNWAIFALSGGVTITDPVATYGDLNSYDVLGNVGLGGTGNLSMTASWIRGNVVVQNGTQTSPTGAPFLTGTRTVNNTAISNGITSANSATTAASLLNVNDFGSGLTALTFTGFGGGGPGASISLAAAASITGVAATTYVINVTDLILNGSAATLTLNGTNTTNYIFNVSRFMSLGTSAKIVLGGSGITEANVLFNVKSSVPQYDVTLAGGSEAHGIILAPTRSVKLTGASKLFGEVIAKGVSLSGVSKVINPFVSP